MPSTVEKKVERNLIGLTLSDYAGKSQRFAPPVVVIRRLRTLFRPLFMNLA